MSRHTRPLWEVCTVVCSTALFPPQGSLYNRLRYHQQVTRLQGLPRYFHGLRSLQRLQPRLSPCSPAASRISPVSHHISA